MAHWSTLRHADTGVTQAGMQPVSAKADSGHERVIELDGQVIGKTGGHDRPRGRLCPASGPSGSRLRHRGNGGEHSLSVGHLGRDGADGGSGPAEPRLAAGYGQAGLSGNRLHGADLSTGRQSGGSGLSGVDAAPRGCQTVAGADITPRRVRSSPRHRRDHPKRSLHPDCDCRHPSGAIRQGRPPTPARADKARGGGANGQRPSNSGGRLSRNAATPSRKSRLRPHWPCNAASSASCPARSLPQLAASAALRWR